MAQLAPLCALPTHTESERERQRDREREIESTLLAVDVMLANNHNKAEQGPCQIDVSVIDTYNRYRYSCTYGGRGQIQCH